MLEVVRRVVLCSILFGAASTAHAQDPFAKPASAEAREHLSRGNKFYGVRDFDKAIAEYKAGALAEQAPIFDYNLGQCYRQLGNYEAAKWHYQQFLRRAAPQGEVLEAVRNFIAQMDAELQKQAMSQAPTDAAPMASAADATPIRSASATPPDARDDAGARASERRSFRALAWGLTGAGVVGVAVGGGLLWNAATLRDDANHTADQRDRDALFDKADSRGLLGTVIGVSGGALLTAGVITFLLDGRDDASAHTAWRIRFAPHGAYVVGWF